MMIKSITLRNEEEYLEINLNDGKTYSYPWVWLRNNCQCNSCIYGPSKSRRVGIEDIVIDIHVDNAEIAEDGEAVNVKWSDGHASAFKLDWLLYYRLTPEGMEERRNAHRLPVKLWGNEKASSITEIEFNELIQDDQALYKWLKTMETEGITIVRNAPTEEKAAFIQMAKRVNAWLRPEHHGHNLAEREIWGIRTDMHQQSVAYTQGKLNLHTDMGYYDNPAGTLLLQCLEQTSKGGDSLFADGFKVASIMKELYPDYYKILTTCPLYHHDIGCYYYQFHFAGYGPVIRLDERGAVKSVALLHNWQRPVEAIKIEDVKTFYKAYKTFGKLLEDNHIEFKMKPGDMACIDNHRVLHGRLAFELQPGDVRHLQGTHIEWDELRSARRVLDEKFNH